MIILMMMMPQILKLMYTLEKQTSECIEDGILSETPIKNFFITYQSESFVNKKNYFLAEITYNTILNYLNKVIKPKFKVL